MKKKKLLKGISLALAGAIAMFAFLLGCCNQPLSLVLVTSISAVYVAYVTYSEAKKQYGHYEWLLIAYLFITGCIMLLSHIALGILFLLPIIVYLFLVNAYGILVVNMLLLAAQIFVAVWVFSSCENEIPYQNIEGRYEASKKVLVKNKVVSKEEIKNVNNIYDLEELYINQKHKADAVNKKLEGIKNTIKVRDYDSVEIPEVKQLYIKRLWYNSEQTPWSYEAYGKLKFNVSSRYKLFSGRTDINAKLDHDGEYEGEYNVEYINIVLSDNTFYRFKVADNYQWLVAKEGDKVTKTFSKKDLDFEKLHQPVIKSELKFNF